MSQVYGKKRTKRVKQAKITHLTESHGTRYDGYIEIGQYMRGEIIRGRAMFEEYLSHTPGMKEQLDSYRADVFSYRSVKCREQVVVFELSLLRFRARAQVMRTCVCSLFFSMRR